MAERQSVRMSKITNDGRLNPVWHRHRMLYSRTHMATVGVKGLIALGVQKTTLKTRCHIAA